MDILLVDFLGKPVWSWIGFLVLVLALLVFDLGVLQRKSHEIGIRESLMLSAFHISIGLAIQTIMAASSALREFIRLPILGLRRMSPMAGRTATSQSYTEGRQWAVRVPYRKNGLRPSR